MEKIICEKCKNAYLQKNEEGYFCSSCGMFHPMSEENLLLGIHYYKEGSLKESADYLMKAIVNDGSNYKPLLYKALGDGFSFDEDTTSISSVYEQIIFAGELVPDSDFPKFLEIANDETEKLERAFAEIHINAFEAADAEKIKSVVSLILKIQEEAKSFRSKLADLADAYNKRNGNVLVYNLSKCFFVTPEKANEIGHKKLNKIKSDIASHTVFTGILTTDIRNLEIYYRCIVMFFQKSKDKYDFLMGNAENFVTLASVLEEGNYTSITGTASTSEKLKISAYSFFEESLKGEEEIDEEVKTVVLLTEEAVEDTPAEATEPDFEVQDIEATEPEESIEVQDVEVQDIDSDSQDVAVVEVEEIEISTDVETEEVQETEIIEEPTIETTSNDVDFAHTAPQETLVNEPVLEADTVTELPNTSTEFGDIFNSNESIEATADENTTEEEPIIPQNHKTKEFTINISETNELGSEDADATDASEQEEFEPLETPEEKERRVRKERYKKFKGVNTETAEFQSLAKKFDPARKNDPNRETTIVPKKNNKKKVLIGVIIFIVAVIAVNAVRFLPGFIAETKYNSALELMEEKNYTAAIAKFQELGEFQESEEKIKECKYLNALALIDSENYTQAKTLLQELKGYKDDIETKIQVCDYAIAKDYLESKKYDEAKKLFESLKNYGDSKDMVKECSYQKAVSLIESKKYEEAIEILKTIKKHSNASEKINEAKYLYVTENLTAENKTTVAYLKELAKINYRNSLDLKTELLGASADTSLKFFVNTSSTDLETSLESVSHTRSAYFHIIALDDTYYGERLTVKYTTQYNYTWSNTVTLSKDNTSTVVIYPPTDTSNYSVTFSVSTADGENLGTQKITIS